MNTKEIYRNDCESVWGNDGKMIEYEMKNLSSIVTFSTGEYIVFNKPSIKKHFCFGYGMNGITSQEEMEDAYAQEHKAMSNSEYFIAENMKQITELIDAFNNDSYNVFLHTKYYRESDECNLKGYSFVRTWEEPCTNLRISRQLTDDERKQVVDALKEEMNKFLKRLNTYLKRYGLEKINTWTYLVD